MSDGGPAPGPPDLAPEPDRSGLWNAIVGAIGILVGFAPHVAHHAGLLVGTALIAGAGGTVVFGALGLLASLPLLLRLRRRFGTWWAPAAGLLIFAAMFSLSAFLLGPMLGGGGAPSGGHGSGH